MENYLYACDGDDFSDTYATWTKIQKRSEFLAEEFNFSPFEDKAACYQMHLMELICSGNFDMAIDCALIVSCTCTFLQFCEPCFKAISLGLLQIYP